MVTSVARARVVGAFACLLLAVVPLAADRPYVLLGDSTNFAMGQPRVAIEVYDANRSSFGPAISNDFLLDSGAQGLVVVGTAAEELIDEGYQTVAVFDEAGIGGLTHPYDVSESYNMDFAGSDGNRHTLTGVRLMSDANITFGDFSGIVGVSAMLNLATSMVFEPMAETFPEPIHVSFEHAVPTTWGHRYHVPLELREYPPTGQRDANDPLPTYAPLPFLPAEVRHGGAAEANWLIADTGAQISILSTTMAFALGLDENGDGNLADDALGTVPLTGAGGEIEALIMQVDEIRLLTDENIDLVWGNCQIVVVDIDPSIPGVIGADLLTSGWLEAWGERLLGTDPTARGYLERCVFDLLDANSGWGTLVIDVEPGHDQVVPAPAALPVMLLTAAWVLRRRRGRPAR